MRRPLIAGNWKLHCGPSEARKLALEIRNGLMGRRDAVDVLLCPPCVSLAAVGEIVQGSGIALGAQNVFWETSGAWTGEVAAPMLVDAGCGWVILGHSERRQHFGESNASVARRLRAALAAGLECIVCVGETLEERESGATERVVTTQVREGLDALDAGDWARVTLAYEPVWAIGTGRTATPEQAQEVHALLRDLVGQRAGAGVAQQTRIQYGGSVKPANAATLLGQADVDGALVGGASLDASAFLAIVEAAAVTPA
ncbi:MAG: triose-phosphate isomerase [Candidatus Latescibacterota bacterium]|nr:MAG: triose-phosphate isomerase [Candidatus Latescibacterota bacterium]